MARSQAVLHTSQAQRLMTRLGRHWGHKFDVTLDDAHLLVPFSAEAQVALQATDGTLDITLHHSDPAEIATLQRVVAEHLQRFSKDEALVFAWQP